MGLHCIPGGGMSSQIRLAMIESVGATVVCCTPTYALRLAEIAEHERPLSAAGREHRAGADRRGRAGRQHPADAGAHRAELGRARHRSSRADRSRSGELRVLGGARDTCTSTKGEFICEVLDPATGRPVAGRRTRRARRHEPGPNGEPGHPLPHRRHRRAATDAVRVRTHVGAARRRHPRRAPTTWSTSAASTSIRSGIEAVVRRFAEVVEFRSIVSAGRADAIAEARDRGRSAGGRRCSDCRARGVSAARGAGPDGAGHVVAGGTLPRFEMKASRFVVEA